MARTTTDTLATLGRWGTLLLKNIVPICEKDARGHAQGHGTGLLVAYQQNNYLVTAAHVLDPLKDKRRLFYPCAKKAERSIAGRMLLTPPPPGKSRQFDAVDVGVVKLEGEGQPPYPEVDKECLPFDCLKPHATPRRSKSYFVTGFPATKTKTHVRNQQVEVMPYSNWCSSIDDADYDPQGLQSGLNIALSFDVRNVQVDDGPRKMFPNPQGMSGSPIWLLCDHLGVNDATRNLVVGILIEHHRSKQLLIGTDISVAMDMIYKLS